MPSIINATTTNGLSTSADNSGSLQLATNNGTTAVTIDTSQRVGIGTASPTATNFSKMVQIAGASAVGLSATSSSGPNGEFGALGGSVYVASTNAYPLIFAANNVEAMQVSTGQQVGIGKSPAVTLDVNGAINYDPNVSVNGLSVVSRATYDDGVNRTLGAAWNNTFGVITIKGTGGATNIPFFGNGGSGIGFACTALDPDAGTWSYGAGPTITFTNAGSGGNTFVLAFLGGSGTFNLQRTAGSGSFTVVIQHYTT
jgi:hypothetical protein